MIPYVSLTPFYCIRKCDYAYTKVGRPVEDNCKQCFCFTNRHTYFANDEPNSPASLQLDSSTNDSLFQPLAEDDNEPDPELTGFEPNAIDDVEPRNKIKV